MKRLTLAAACAVSLLACTPAPPVHPLGATCTWPTVVDVDGDRLAVLQFAYDLSDDQPSEVALVEIDTGTVRARCTGLSHTGIEARLPPWTEQGPVNRFPVLSPDLRHGVTPDGVIDMTTGTLTPNFDPAWPAVGLVGGTTVLRQDARYNGSPDDARPSVFCLAPRFDAPQSDCEPLAGEGPGVPVPHADGTTGWASAVLQPLTLTAPNGSAVTAYVQTDGTDIVRLQTVAPETGSYLGRIGDAVTRRSGRMPFDLTPGDGRTVGQLAWYVADATTGTGRLHLAPLSQDGVVRQAGMSDPYPRSAVVVEEGRAILYVVGETYQVAIVRADESGALSTVLTFATGPPGPSQITGDARSTTILGTPIILDWPEPTGTSPL